MAYLKQGTELQNEQDLQNLVVGILHRMPTIQKNFTSRDVIRLVRHFSKGAKFPITNNMISEKVINNLSFYQLNSKVECKNGIYHFLPLKLKVF